MYENQRLSKPMKMSELSKHNETLKNMALNKNVEISDMLNESFNEGYFKGYVDMIRYYEKNSSLPSDFDELKNV